MPLARFNDSTIQRFNVPAKPSPLAENDSRLGQVVGRKLHRNLVPGDDANEMLAHLTRDVSPDIPLPGKIDAEHRAVTICSSLGI
jgi:hypothetical protein